MTAEDAPLPVGRCASSEMRLIERGACVAAHVDAGIPPADVVATLALGGGSRDSVRVGNVVIPLQAGDLYLIGSGWEVDHEVYASTCDRLSITFRYVHEAHAAAERTDGDDTRE